MHASTTPSRRGRAIDLALAATLVLATLVVYAPVRDFGFVNFDDPGYVAAKPEVQRGLDRTSALWALTTTDRASWSPVTWLSYLLDVELFGVDAGAMHVVSVLLHAVVALLLFALVRRLGAAPATSFLGAALFALHPLRVESVAWISERKDVLCALFALLALHAWVGFARHGGATRYVAALLLFALGLMAKPMLVTLPFVLLLLDYWPLGRTHLAPGASERGDAAPLPTARLLVEKLPFLALSLTASWITFVAQRAAGAVADTTVLPPGTRLAGVLAAYGWYVEKTLWPSGLAALYPNPALLGRSAPVLDVVVGGGVLVAVSLLALRAARRRPWLLVGWAIFVGMLVPVIGLVQVGQQSTADRYTYLPGIGLTLVLLGLAGEAVRRLRAPRAVVLGAAAGVLLALALVTRAQLASWRDSVALAERAIAVTEDNYVMQFNLAQALDERGDVAGALRHYAEAARLRPDLARFRVNLGAALARAGRPDEAVAQYRAAMALDAGEVAAANNLAWLLATHPSADQRDGAEALELARGVVRLRPDDPHALDLLAAALAEAGRFSGAERAAAAAIDAAQSAGRDDLVAAITARRALYMARRGYREDPTTMTPVPQDVPTDLPLDGAAHEHGGHHHH